MSCCCLHQPPCLVRIATKVAFKLPEEFGPHVSNVGFYFIDVAVDLTKAVAPAALSANSDAFEELAQSSRSSEF